MHAFQSGREAKEFLISHIVEEAQRQNIPLSEVERKMLYFTESGGMHPDLMKVNEEFDREYDQDEYERKIAGLVTKADKRIRKGSRDDCDRWQAAIRLLEREDHYILVMIRLAAVTPHLAISKTTVGRRGDQLRLLATGLGIVAALLTVIFLCIKYDVDLPWRVDIGTFVWAFFACWCVAFMLLRFIIGGKKADDLVFTAMGKLSRIWRRVSGSA